MEYTKEQIEDIAKREKMGIDYLRSIGLTPAAVIQKINIGNDTFADKLQPYLQDTRYTPNKSPIQDVKVDKKD